MFSSSDAVDGGENVLDRLLRLAGSSGDHLKLLAEAFELLLPMISGEAESACSGTGASFDLERDSVSFKSRGPDRPTRRTWLEVEVKSWATMGLVFTNIWLSTGKL